MPETYEKDGVIYFREPYRVDATDWVCSCLDCDSIVDEIDDDSDTMLVYAYSKDYNKLKCIKGDHLIIGSFSSREVNGID